MRARCCLTNRRGSVVSCASCASMPRRAPCVRPISTSGPLYVLLLLLLLLLLSVGSESCVAFFFGCYSLIVDGQNAHGRVGDGALHIAHNNRHGRAQSLAIDRRHYTLHHHKHQCEASFWFEKAKVTARRFNGQTTTSSGDIGFARSSTRRQQRANRQHRRRRRRRRRRCRQRRFAFDATRRCRRVVRRQQTRDDGQCGRMRARATAPRRAARVGNAVAPLGLEQCQTWRQRCGDGCC
jgi:hypothetical protein